VELLVTYDVATVSTEGQRRLRRVAKICEAFGQRVQYSVFECIVSPAQMEQLMHRLEEAIAPEEDSLRIYRLQEPRERHLRVLGRAQQYDLREPLVF
jgi:CRISPR-associated protein Cas2